MLVIVCVRTVITNYHLTREVLGITKLVRLKSGAQIFEIENYKLNFVKN